MTRRTRTPRPVAQWQRSLLARLHAEMLNGWRPWRMSSRSRVFDDAIMTALLLRFPEPATFTEANTLISALAGDRPALLAYARRHRDWYHCICGPIWAEFGPRGGRVPHPSAGGWPWTEESWPAYVQELVERDERKIGIDAPTPMLRCELFQ